MNQEESLAFYTQGRKAWNEWAQGMLAAREALEAAGDRVAGWDRDAWNDATRDWHAAAKADFTDHEFADNADFDAFLFPSDAEFYSATFSGDAGFHSATFFGYAGFDSATFSGYAGFDRATFSGNVGFFQAVFDGRADFDAVQFENEANFHAMRGRVRFSLAEVGFRAVPDFIEANFREAPWLDNLYIEPGRFAPLSIRRIRDYFKGDPDRSARWRALKRLAVQGHDHEQELVFFKGELRSRRWVTDKPWHAMFWFGWAYQLLSDFGSSVIRPFALWAVGIAGFGFYYLGKSATLAGKSALGLLGIAGAPPLSCVAGQGDPVLAALQLSLRKGLLFLGLDSTDKLKQIYACLYGVATRESGALSSGFIPVIPDGVALLSLLQLVYSAVLIFLVLLALRNHFRIK